MVQMMEVRSKIRKTPFFRTINPEKMINRIFYPLNFRLFPEMTLSDSKQENFTQPLVI
jgi:hypothetical protein